MSRPRNTSFFEVVGLVSLGLITSICVSPLLLRETFSPDYRILFGTILTACLIYPTSLLAFIRKNIAVKHGDWRILVYILVANYVLFWLASSGK